MSKCKMGSALEALPKKYKVAVQTALDDHFKTASFDIEDKLYEAGFEVSERTIDRHRTNRCKCRKEETNE